MRDNRSTAELQQIMGPCKVMLREVSKGLSILDPEHGDKELIESVAVVLASLNP